MGAAVCCNCDVDGCEAVMLERTLLLSFAVVIAAAVADRTIGSGPGTLFAVMTVGGTVVEVVTPGMLDPAMPSSANLVGPSFLMKLASVFTVGVPVFVLAFGRRQGEDLCHVQNGGGLGQHASGYDGKTVWRTKSHRAVLSQRERRSETRKRIIDGGSNLSISPIQKH